MTTSNMFAEGNIIPFKNCDNYISSVSAARSIGEDHLLKKALLIHTSNRKALGEDERNIGWGIIDEQKADAFMSVENRNKKGLEIRNTVSAQKTHFYSYVKKGNEQVVATLAWNKDLNHDLDIRVINSGRASFPISIDAKGEATTKRDNTTLTVERVDLTSKVKGEFTIQVTVKNKPKKEIPFLLLVTGAEFSEKVTKREERNAERQRKASAREERIEAYLEKTGEPRDTIINGGKRIIYDVEDGKPIYKSTCNTNAAKSNGVHHVQSGGSLGLDLTGKNLVRSLGLWDGGNALRTHQEFGDRVTYGENTGSEEHGTHVAGTMIGAGVQSNARGMAYEAEIVSYDFSNDESEMSLEAQNGCILSNHSYMSGQFTKYGRDWDILANNNPYYSIMKAAANEGPSYNTMPINSNSKNVLTVGSGADQANGYVGPNVSVSSFSSRGPTPDGRIKPDFISNGAGLTSASNSSNSSYTSMSGTSMACPSASGAAALMQEHYYMTHGNVYMLSSTLKGLIINSTDEVGGDGPDYNSGYGYINAGSACKIISDNNGGAGYLINELTLANGETFEIDAVPVPGEEVNITLCWNDPAASSSSGTESKLVNDLDLRVDENGTVHMPWKCNPASPSSSATKGDNSADNVEKIEIANANGSLTIKVSHKGSLSSVQTYSLVMSGVLVNTDPFISVKSPVDGAELERYSEMAVSWVSNADDNVSVELYKGLTLVETLADDIDNSGTLSWDIPEDYELGDDYRVKVSSVTVDTLFDFSDEFSIIDELIITELPYVEDLDTLDTNTTVLPFGYDQSTDDDIDWIVFAGPTPSKVGISPDVTGPDGDNTTGGGNYIYVEASNPNNPGKTADFTTPNFTLDALYKPLLIFSYHMFSDSATMGTLELDIESDGNTTNKVLEFNDTDYGDEWHTDTVELADYEGKRVNFTFRAATGDDWASDICIDDITVVNSETVDNIELVDDDDIRAKGFTAGPNPSKSGNPVHFVFNPAKNNIIDGYIEVYDLLGNSLYKEVVGFCPKGKNSNVGKWNTKNFNGINVSKGTYLVLLTVRNTEGNTYRIQKIIGIN